MKTKEELKSSIIEALKTIYDPEIPVDVYELGLIYEVNIDDKNHVEVIMTLTSPSCPVATGSWQRGRREEADLTFFCSLLF